MTELEKWKAEAPSAFRKGVLGTLVGILCTGGVAWATGIVGQAREVIQAPTVLAEQITRLELLVEANADGIRRLTVPTNIFDLSDLSGPPLGHCVEGEDCDVRFRVRRTQQGLGCDIVPESASYYYRNGRANEVYAADVVRGRPRDVGTSYTNVTLRLTTPFGVAPKAELCTRPAYTNCPGTTPGADPISPDEECVEVTIKPATPPAPRP